MAIEYDLPAAIESSTEIQSIEPIDDLAVDTNGAAATLSTFDHGQSPIVEVTIGTSVFTPTASNYLCVEVEEYDGSSWTDVPDARISKVALKSAGTAAPNTGTIAVIDATDRDALTYRALYRRSGTTYTQIRVVANFVGTVTGGLPICAKIYQTARSQS